MAEEIQEEYPIQDNTMRGLIQSPAESSAAEQTVQLIRVLTDHDNILDVLKMELRGEQLYQSKDGERMMVQTDKPAFVILDKLNKPIKIINPKTHKEEYLPNEEAINEVISILKFIGLNPVAPMTTIDENEIRADLLEIESKLAVLLTVKRKSWGIDKAQYPIIIGKIKVLVKDARYRSKDGVILKALRTITSRIEQSHERQKPQSLGSRMLSPFS